MAREKSYAIRMAREKSYAIRMAREKSYAIRMGHSFDNNFMRKNISNKLLIYTLFTIYW
jgi:hypothetical protein